MSKEMPSSCFIPWRRGGRPMVKNVSRKFFSIARNFGPLCLSRWPFVVKYKDVHLCMSIFMVAIVVMCPGTQSIPHPAVWGSGCGGLFPFTRSDKAAISGKECGATWSISDRSECMP